MAMFTKDQLYNAVNAPMTKAIFHEFRRKESPDPILSLYTEDVGLPILRNLYVSLTVDDPSEGIFVEEVFGDQYFWDNLSKAPFMEQQLKSWRHEADVKRKSKAFQVLTKEIEDGGRNAYNAAKYFIEEPWKPKTAKSNRAKSKSSAEAVPSHITDLTEYIRNKK